MKQESQVEIWKDIEGYEGIYQVSNKGKVKSMPRIPRRFERPDMAKGRILKQQFVSAGYLKVALCKAGTEKTAQVHKLVANAFLMKPDGAEVVNHIDFDKTNNSVDNLEWCTQKYNIHHSAKYFRLSHGENHPHSKLTENQVREIRAKHIPYKYSAAKLAKEYGVAQISIKRILNRRFWRHVA
jgi:hypothetical protein